MNGNLLLGRIKMIWSALIITGSVLIVALDSGANAQAFDGVFFPDIYPIVGGFAVSDWIPVFIALEFLLGWISFYLTVALLKRFTIFSGFNRVLLLLVPFMVYSFIILFVLLNGFGNPDFTRLFSSSMTIFLAGDVCGAVISTILIFDWSPLFANRLSKK